jgi:hypothetical protein
MLRRGTHQTVSNMAQETAGLALGAMQPIRSEQMPVGKVQKTGCWE